MSEPRVGDIWEFKLGEDVSTWLLLKNLDPDDVLIVLEAYETYWQVLNLEDGVVGENIIAVNGGDSDCWRKLG